MSEPLGVRVKVEDAWDEVFLDLSDTTPLSELKRQALERTHVHGNPAEYIIKYRGAAVDESRSLGDAGVVPNAALIVLARRRRAVR